MKTSFSDKSQWGILQYLYRVYPRSLTDSEVRQLLGCPTNAGLVANIRQLISEGSVEHNAIVKIMGRPTVSASRLRLTPEGLKLMENSLQNTERAEV